MNEIFLKMVNMSISASWLVLVVLILRFVLKKTPKWCHVLLWGIVAIRLLCPFSIESAFSLIPSAEAIPISIAMDTEPMIDSGFDSINDAVNPMLSQSNMPVAGAGVNPLQIRIAIYSNIWCCGIVALFLYMALSYFYLYRKVNTAVLFRGNVFQSENVNSPFVLGVIKPRIYVPFQMEEQNLGYVIAHEQAHIRRKDHWWKPLGFLLLTIHWFNPLMWVAYVILCRDIELACDEKVIKELDNEKRADYTQALVVCSTDRRMITACPLAFGEVGVKERVRAVMNYRKPTFWMVAFAIISCVVLAICFLTNPVTDDDTDHLVPEDVMTSDTQEETIAVEPEMNMDEVYTELETLVDSIGLENAYPWNNTVEFKEDADVLIKLASDETGRFEIYGIMSAKYGTYGLLLNDWIGGEQNWNFACVPWYYSGAPSDQPILEPDGNGKYVFSYVYKNENGIPFMKEWILDCGYDTGHMELMPQEDYDAGLK